VILSLELLEDQSKSTALYPLELSEQYRTNLTNFCSSVANLWQVNKNILLIPFKKTLLLLGVNIGLWLRYALNLGDVIYFQNKTEESQTKEIVHAILRAAITLLGFLLIRRLSSSLLFFPYSDETFIEHLALLIHPIWQLSLPKIFQSLYLAE
jgi:hypothetical protein